MLDTAIGLLDMFEPPGKIKPPKTANPELTEETPADQADVALKMLVHELRAATSREEFEAAVPHMQSVAYKDEPNWMTEMMDRFDRNQRMFSRLRRNLQLTFKRKKGD